ncbi:glucan endo-1,3-beta-glucosidase GIV-like isoform X2 [Lolium rigidum]|uniref:glucan endo-1,3-beta-glucosidase GIV-like isoform X2 n=1 Tax=Lolium rigidum TaxID=89674 RepID=UPI001F5CA680|nr:glucan endo-1,3-beta-glucosidase GIV-like isoform X2 [Lolium rigidum]
MSTMRGFAPVLSAVLLVGVLIASAPAGVQSIGVCYGIIGSNLPSPQDVVQLYRSLAISGMRVYTVEPPALDALRNAGIDLILGTTNDDVAHLAASASNAAFWVQTNVKPYYPDVKIKYIAVGNELTGGAAQSIPAAMRNLNDALGTVGLSAIKVSTAVKMDVIANSFPPSGAVFAQPYMTDVAQILATIGAPLLANVYPYFAYLGNPGNINLSYATFQPGAPPLTDSGNRLVYTNLFDAMVDAIYAALEKAGAPGVRVVVSESGWPSAGGVAATMENARAYNQGLVDHVAHGTPKKPVPIEAYLFAMFNENQKTGEETERNFGLFYPANKAPVYPINFAGSVAANRTHVRASRRH